MLVLSRQRDESIIIGDNIVVTIVDIRGDKVRLGIEAPVRSPCTGGRCMRPFNGKISWPAAWSPRIPAGSAQTTPVPPVPPAAEPAERSAGLC